MTTNPNSALVEASGADDLEGSNANDPHARRFSSSVGVLGAP